MAWAVDSPKAKACLRRHTRQCGALARAAAAAVGSEDPPSLEPLSAGWWLAAKTELHRLLRSQPEIFGAATPGWDGVVALDAAALQGTTLWLTCSVELATAPHTLSGHADTAARRDAALLRSQLEPHPTEQLRQRLVHSFGVAAPLVRGMGREDAMGMLLGCYEKEGERAVRRMRGTPLSVGLREALLAELRGTDWIRTMRERRSVNAEGYVTVERPGAKQYGTNGGCTIDKMVIYY